VCCSQHIVNGTCGRINTVVYGRSSYFSFLGHGTFKSVLAGDVLHSSATLRGKKADCIMSSSSCKIIKRIFKTAAVDLGRIPFR
jgi:hypothetical protein